MDKLPKPFVENVEINPYAPPQADVASVLRERDLSEAYATASKVKRFFNWMIDRLMIMGMSFAFGFLLALADELGILLGGLDFLESMGRFQGYVLAAIFTVLYYWPMEFFFGRTLGKLVTGTKVLNEAGTAPGAWAVFLRSVFRLVPFEPFSMLLANTAWHDGWSETQVIDLRNKQTVRLSPALRRLYR